MKRILLLGILLFACIGLISMPSVSAAGDTVTIALSANPSTGYSWTYKMSEDDVLCEESSKFVPARSGEAMVGSGGKQVCVFRAKKPGSVAITFTYKRPWKNGSASSDSVTYYYAVDSNLTITKVGHAASSTHRFRPSRDPEDML